MNFTMNFKSCGNSLNMPRPAAIYISDFDIFDVNFDFFDIDGTLRDIRPIFDEGNILFYAAKFGFFVGNRAIVLDVGFAPDYSFPDSVKPLINTDAAIPVTVDLSYIPFWFGFDGFDCNLIFQFSHMQVREGNTVFMWKV